MFFLCLICFGLLSGQPIKSKLGQSFILCLVCFSWFKGMLGKHLLSLFWFFFFLRKQGFAKHGLAKIQLNK